MKLNNERYSSLIWLAVLLATAGSVSSQEPASFDAGYRAPKTAVGQPDLQGVWSNAILTPLERPREFADQAFLTEEQAADYQSQRLQETYRGDRTVDVETDVSHAYNNFWWDWGTEIAKTRRTSMIIDPPDGRIPALTPEAQARRDARLAHRAEHPADGPEDRLLRERCIVWDGNNDSGAGPPMMPASYNNNFRIVQTEDYVLLLKEMVHETRIVPLDGRPHLPNTVRQWLGSSRARWEGETLVIETTNLTDETNYQGASENMHLTERFTRVADDILLYEFTVDDPSAFSQPWTAQIPTVRQDGLIYEFACHETNRGMMGLLSGARAEEAAAGEVASE
jgi:hypothetical protein